MLKESTDSHKEVVAEGAEAGVESRDGTEVETAAIVVGSEMEVPADLWLDFMCSFSCRLFWNLSMQLLHCM